MGLGLYPTRDYAGLAQQGYADVANTYAHMTKKDSKQVSEITTEGGGGGIFGGILGGATAGAGIMMALKSTNPAFLAGGAFLGGLSYLF